MNCEICGQECVTDLDKKYSCNGAVLGGYIQIKGHKVCVDNVDNKVVIPNRLRLALIKIGGNKW